MKTALLIIDMQQTFRGMVKRATPNIKLLHSFFSNNSMPIIFTQHGHNKNELTPPIKNQLVKKWGVTGSIHAGSSEWQFIPAIREMVGESEIVAKNTYDAFINTNLAELLERDKVGRVVVCGVMTDCCCETTARSAFNRGWETWLVGDACGSVDEEQHRRSLNDYGFGYGPVWTTDEVLEVLGRDTDA